MLDFELYGFYSNQDSYLVTTMVGSLGFSKSECIVEPLFDNHEHHMLCQSGYITELVDWGVITSSKELKRCMRKENNPCIALLNNDLVAERIKDCYGRSDCLFPSPDEFLIPYFDE